MKAAHGLGHTWNMQHGQTAYRRNRRRQMAEAPWQKGYPLEQLKALAAPFKQRHKPLVFGAFGLTKELDIADALSKSRLVWSGDPPEAVAIAHVIKRESAQQDFAQRPYVIPEQFCHVKAFASLSVTTGVKVLRAIAERASVPVVIEIFEEDEVAKHAVDAMQWRYVATKISAGSEIKGVYSSHDELPSIEELPAEDTAALEVLDPKFAGSDLPAILRELTTYGEEHFAQHYSDYNKRKSWTSFALRGYDPHDASFIIKPAEMSKSWKEENAALLSAKPQWTKASLFFPNTLELLKRLGLEYDRVRFMRLRHKDGELSRHADITDREAGTADGKICRLHIPIVTSDAVTFMGWNHRGQKVSKNLPAGALCYLDQRKPHAVTNKDPDLDRTHLVVDCLADERLRKKIRASLVERPARARARAA